MSLTIHALKRFIGLGSSAWLFLLFISRIFLNSFWFIRSLKFRFLKLLLGRPWQMSVMHTATIVKPSYVSFDSLAMSHIYDSQSCQSVSQISLSALKLRVHTNRIRALLNPNPWLNPSVSPLEPQASRDSSQLLSTHLAASNWGATLAKIIK